jgi:hypothetical protein
METLIVPSSIQRIRSFLVEICGMKVKPWAGTEETLAALHTTLCIRGGCDIFWTSLRGLLENLARDLKTRQQALPGTLVDNEVLDSESYATLLNEIRAALARQAEAPAAGSFRRLATALSAPALGLLLLLGGVASVGCDSSPLHTSNKPQDAAAPDLANPQDPQPVFKIDAPIKIILPDAAPIKDAATTGPDGATVTIQDIMESCNLSAQLQGTVLACLAQLRESWTTGVAQALAGNECSHVDYELSCFVVASTCRLASAEDFNPTDPICKPIPIYIGVRFV